MRKRHDPTYKATSREELSRAPHNWEYVESPQEQGVDTILSRYGEAYRGRED